jgi:hypothetical protein
VFEQARSVTVSLDLMVEKENGEPLEIDVTDRHGERVACLSLLNGTLSCNNQPLRTYERGRWQHLEFSINGSDINAAGRHISTLHAVRAVERLSIRTGAYRNLPNRNTPNQDKCAPLPGCDERMPAAVYWIDNVEITAN